MKITLFCVALGLFSATAGEAQEITGRWSCIDQSAGREVLSLLLLDRNGTLRVDETISATSEGKSIQAQVSKQAKWSLAEGFLVQSNPKIKIRRFKLGGKKMRKGPQIDALHASLLSEALRPTRILSVQGNRMTIQISNRIVFCDASGNSTSGNNFCDDRANGLKCRLAF